MNMKTMSAPLIPAAATAPSMYLSVIFSVSPASHGGGLRLNSNFVGLLVFARRFFLPSPGRRLISIMCLCSGSVLTEGKADREHEERRDLVGHKRLQRAVPHRHRRERVGELHWLLQALPK